MERMRTETASAAAKRQLRVKPSVLKRFIDQLLHRRLYDLALRWCLLQQDEEHVLLAVDHDIATAGAIPFQLAEIAWRWRIGIAALRAHAK